MRKHEEPSRTRFEHVLLIAGMVMCIACLLGLGYRAATSRLGIRVFENGIRITSSPVIRVRSGLGKDLIADYRFWSIKRITAYEDALARIVEPPLAVLRVPRLGIEAPVYEGTSELVLNRGVGWIIGTARPGIPGNSGIAGHRDGFFRSLKDIALGDKISLATSATPATYTVDRITIVDPTDVGVLAPTESATLTLITCYPFYFVGDAPKRYIVRCSLDSVGNRNPEEKQ